MWEYDACGNITATRKYAYTTNGVTWSYTYDADGLRTGRTDGTNTYQYIYAGDKLVRMIYNGEVVDISYAGSQPLSLTYDGATYYYVLNGQGDVIGLTDSTGTMAIGYTYGAYGTIMALAADENLAPVLVQMNPLTYRGYVYDRETQLYYLQSRYYDPELGRFINADAYASTGQGVLGNNMFAYCGNNPLCYTDATGEIATEIIVSAGIAGGLYGLLSYLMSTSEPSIDGALVAISTGAAGAVAGIYAGPADEIMKLVLSAFAGIGSAISAWDTMKQNGGNTEDCVSAALTAFVTCGGTTYLGSYIDFPMLQGMAEAAAVFDVNILSGFASTSLSFPTETIFDQIIACLTYAPNYIPTRYAPIKKSGGCGIAGYCVKSFSA